MDTRADVIIVGGGIIGCAIADALCKQSLRVRIIDAGDGVPAATHSAAGMLAPSAEFDNADTAPTAISTMGMASLSAWPHVAERLHDQTGIDPDFRPYGTLSLSPSGNRKVGASEACEQTGAYPALNLDGFDTALLGHEAQIDPILTLRALRKLLRKVETCHWTMARVTDIAAATDTSAIVQIETGERYEAGAVILASGVGLTRIKTPFSFPPIVPVKGVALALEHALPPRFPVVRCGEIYLCPRTDGRLIIGASEERGQESLTIDRRTIDDLRRRATAILPALADAPERHRWAGVRPGTPDHNPHLGHSGHVPRSILFAVGHYRNGILLAPQTAAIITDQLCATEPGPIPAAFAPHRAYPA